MSDKIFNQVWLKGQNIKTKTLKKRKKVMEAMTEAKLAKQNRENPPETEEI